MNNLSIFLISLPAVVMFGITIYMKNIHEGVSKERAITTSWSYGILAAGFFAAAFVLKLSAANSYKHHQNARELAFTDCSKLCQCEYSR